MRQRPFFLLILFLAATAAWARSPWPSLEAQLALDRVPPGSALERLVAENQDFQLLRPEEANDGLDIPLWLRVYWRKQHPETAAYSAADPTGGYPLVLKEVHEWMRMHPDLRAGEARQEAPLEKSKASSTGPDLPISGEQPASRSESDIRVNYWNPSQIVSAANSFGALGNLSIFYSGDGGASWKQTMLPKVNDEEFQSDPTVEWTSDGMAWATAIGIETNPFELRLHAFRSTDGGATWTLDGTFSGSQTRADKQMMWTDHSATSRFKDQIYVIWHDGPTVQFNRRTTGPNGKWGEPRRLSGTETQGTGIGSDIKTNSAGHIFAFWPDTATRRLFVARSLDGGATFGKPIAFAKTFDAFDILIPAQAKRGALIYASGAAFLSGRKSLVYAVWTDLSGATGCNSFANEPQENVQSACKTRIWFSRSTNGGQRWTKPRMINDAKTLNDQFNPWLVVDETTGALGLIYYDTAGESRTQANLWYQSSFDEGVTWTAPLRVSTAASDMTPFGAGNFQYGDYNGFSGIAGTFFPSWTDRRGEKPPQIWTAPIRDNKNDKDDNH